jgi:glycine/D-amino acid oxidase-like deaminating enzyme
VGAEAAEYSDVLIIGAGISGIGAAYRIHERNPGLSYTVLERRERIGGTWDLFRYPGVRSDSDMFTLSFPFEPWRREESIADGSCRSGRHRQEVLLPFPFLRHGLLQLRQPPQPGITWNRGLRRIGGASPVLA